MEIFPSIFLATDLFRSLDWVSRPCKREVVVSFKTQRGLCWVYLFSYRFFGTQLYKVFNCCCCGHFLTANLLPNSGGLVDILK